MAKLVIVYHHPDDPDTFEDYYANQHLPFAGEHMSGVQDAENLKVAGTPDGTPAPYYRISQLTYASMDDLRTAIASADGRAVLADLDNFATGGSTVLLTEE